MKNQIRKTFVLMLIGMVVFLQGCIEIVETVKVNHDRSGSVTLSVGAGQNNPLLSLINQYVDMSFMDDVKSNARQISSVLKSQDGISNVRLRESSWNGGLELSFDFENAKKLNNALYATAGIEKSFFQPNVYKIKNHKFIRKNTTGWIARLIEQEKENIPDEAIFDLVKIKSVFQIPATAKGVNSSCKISASRDNQTFTTSHYLSDLLDKKINTKVAIRY
jgi:hypothetical protein